MDLTLKVWRQKNREDKGGLETYKVSGISEHASFLEMLDVMNEQLIMEGTEPVAFDHDCREGICGTCSLYINGEAHGPDRKVTTCQLHMRMFKDGETIYIEPWRSAALPVIKDLIVDRSAFERIQQSGGFVSINTSGNTQAIPKHKTSINESIYFCQHFHAGEKFPEAYGKCLLVASCRRSVNSHLFRYRNTCLTISWLLRGQEGINRWITSRDYNGCLSS